MSSTCAGDGSGGNPAPGVQATSAPLAAVELAPLTLKPGHKGWRVRPAIVVRSLVFVALVVCGALLAIGRSHLSALFYYYADGIAIEWRVNRENWFHGGVTEIDFSRRPQFVYDDDLAYLKSLNRLQVLDLSDCDQVTDAGLEVIRGLKSLRILELGRDRERELFFPGRRVHLTEACLPYIAGLTDLRQLSLAAAEISDRGLTQLDGLTELEAIDLSETQVTDAGLAHLLVFKNLEFVSLRYTSITDAGLATLTKLPNLKRLDLKGAKVTPEAVTKLMQARPTLDVWPLPEELMPRNLNKVADDAAPR